MRKLALLSTLFVVAVSATSLVTPASAQATRTWISGVGDDVNPCSRTAPCKTFAGAISKTASGGEIDCLDPGGFGAVTITKAMTFDCGTFPGGILASGANAGIIVNAGVNDKVIIRNLVITGASLNNAANGLNGIRFLAGKELLLDRVVIQQFTTTGIDVAQTQGANLILKHVTITQTGVGIKTQSTTGTVAGSLEDVTITDSTSHAIQAVNSTLLAMRDVIMARNAGDGIRSEAASVNLIVENSTSVSNNVGVNAVAGTIRISNVGMYHNNQNLSTNVLSNGNNRSAGNTTTNTPTAGGFTVN